MARVNGQAKSGTMEWIDPGFLPDLLLNQLLVQVRLSVTDDLRVDLYEMDCALPIRPNFA
jgi:hypothetical protein